MVGRMQMMCPKCNGQMRQYERNGVTVDQWGECRGIFLDRGELERLIDAENAWHGGRNGRDEQPHRQRPYRDDDSDEYPVYGGPSGHHGKRHKRRGFLEELFD